MIARLPLTTGMLVYYETLHNGLVACRVSAITPAPGHGWCLDLIVTAWRHPLYDRGHRIVAPLRHVLPRDKALYFRRGRATYVRPFRWLIGNEVKQ